MRKFLISTIAAMLLLCGAGVMLLRWEAWHQRAETVIGLTLGFREAVTPEQLEKEENLARWYNFTLRTETDGVSLSGVYGNLLDFGEGRMGYLEVRDQGIFPIYHEGEASEGVGHQQGTSLPVGGIGNCPVLRCEGITAAPGEVFQIYILDTVLYYEVAEVGDSPIFGLGQDLCVLALSGEEGTRYAAGVRKSGPGYGE